nr:unnamed protein product [Callosobruchus analis]
MLSYVKNYIAKHNSRFGALTTDMWTDQYRRRSYITCTYHFISDEMQLCKFTLATKQVIKNHTAETIKDEIQEVMLSFQIEGKDIHLVTDSGSNMKRAANLLEMSNHLCLGHALHNLITVDGIQKTREVFDLITKCRKIVKHLRYRAPQLEFSANDEQRDLLLSINEIGDHLEESDEEITLSEQQTPIASVSAPPTIKTATPTRWHSVLMMLSSINHKANRRPINLLLQKIGQSTLLLRDNEHKMIEQLISLFQKFKEIVDIMSSESQRTINLVLIFRSEIKRLLEDVEDNENLVLKNLLTDEVYPLKPNIMRPFPSRNLDNKSENFNKRLSRARKCIECAFGIWTGKWRSSGEDNFDINNKEYACSTTRMSRRNNSSSIAARDVRNRFSDFFWETRN